MKRIHLMGIAGSGMSGIASLASKMGYDVTGCDLKQQGHSIDHLKDIDLLIVSPAVLYQSKSDPELVEGLKKKIVMTWEEFLGKFLMKGKKVIAIAGTHGKSTTTAMVAKILIDNNFDPSVVIGAYVPEWDGNSRFGNGDYFIVEADEFNNNFLNYHPDIAVINNIEFDHPDFFKNEEEVIQSFEKFVKNIKEDGDLIAGFHPARLGSLQAFQTARCHLVVADFEKRFKLKVMGEHNQKNANMAYLVAEKLGINKEKIIKSLESFTGIGRRMELLGEVNGIKIFDDYAHHPTAIKTTLAGVRKQYKNEKILAIIEPHGYKRTKALLQDYKNCFDSVDGVFIGPIFKARDKVDASITPQKIADVSKHSNIIALNSFDEVVGHWSSVIGNYDVVVVMGAGNSSLWAKQILHLKI